jgi:hypothetical protein
MRKLVMALTLTVMATVQARADWIEQIRIWRQQEDKR